MKAMTTKILVLLLLTLCISTGFAQTLDQLMKKGDEFYKEFNHKKALETYLKADSLYPANWILMWKISRAYVDIAEKMPQKTDEQEEKKKATFEKALFYADSSVKLAPW